MRTIAYRLALVVFFTLPFENLVHLSGAGRVSKLVGLLVAGFWLLTIAATGEFRRPRVAHLVALRFVVWVGLSLFWTVDVPATRARFITYVQLLGLMFVVWESVTSRARVRGALQAYVLGAWISVAMILFTYATLGSDATTHGRVTTGTFNPNDVGLMLAIAVPVAWYLVSADGARRRRLLWGVNAAYIPASVVAIALTASRAALAGAALGIAYVAISLLRRRPAALVPAVASLVVLAIAVVPLLPERGLGRVRGTATDVTAGGFTGRVPLWREGMDLFRAHPFGGIGGGAFREGALESRKVAHNLVVALLAEVGLVGFTLFALLMILVAVSAWRQPGGLGGMWTTVLLCWVLAAMLHNWEYRKQTWFFFALILAAESLPVTGPRDGGTPDPGSAPARAGPAPETGVLVARGRG